MKDLKELGELIHKASNRLRSCKAPPLLTPLTKSNTLSKLLNANVYLKEENRQFTGSFKYRGALSKITSLSSIDLKKGVVTASSGNHGMACASAASNLKISCKVFLPSNVSELKKQRIIDYGGAVEVVKGDCLVAELTAKEYARKHNIHFISPYNDINVIAGQGSIGIEIIRQLPEVDQVFVAVGGGGLISGIGSILLQHNSNIDVVGCWPINSPVMYKCMQAKKVIEVEELETISDGTAGNIEPDAITLDICRSVIGTNELVSEEKVKQAFVHMLNHEQLLVEGSAAMAVACAIQRYEHQISRGVKNNKKDNIVIVLCGKNIALDKIKQLL